MADVQAKYPNKTNPPHWNHASVEYPVNKIYETGVSSESFCHQWKPPFEVIKETHSLYPEMRDYSRNYEVTRNLDQSETSVDYRFKLPDTDRFNKHTSCLEQHYVYPTSKRLGDRIPAARAHGTSEMRASFTMPEAPPGLVTHKDQYKHPASLPLEPQVEPSWHKELPPLDTTHEGYQVLLDPYLSSSRLYHRPFTADQLRRPSNSRDTVTYYTFDETPWTRTPKPTAGDWWLPRRMPQSVYDREKFKQGFREYRTHNKLFFVPGTFRTETRDNYTKPDRNIHNFEDDVQNYYQQRTPNLPTNISIENLVINNYCTEAGHLGSGRKICTVLDQYIEKNKRLDPAKNKK